MGNLKLGPVAVEHAASSSANIRKSWGVSVAASLQAVVPQKPQARKSRMSWREMLSRRSMLLNHPCIHCRGSSHHLRHLFYVLRMCCT